MTETIPVRKDEECAWPVPSTWRQTLREVVGAINEGNYSLAGIVRVEQLDETTADAIRNNINAYGGTLRELPQDSWVTSVCQWQLHYWEVLIDLFTVEEGRSDLVLHVNVFEEKQNFKFKVHLVYVP